MDFHDEQRIGPHTYAITAGDAPRADGGPPAVAVRFSGAGEDGAVVAEGQLTIPVAGLADAGTFLARTLTGLAAFHGRRPSRPPGRAPNAGRPWSAEQGEQLRERWLAAAPGTPAAAVLGELAAELGRSPSAVRAQLPRQGCDPDVPGRALSESSRQVVRNS